MRHGFFVDPWFRIAKKSAGQESVEQKCPGGIGEIRSSCRLLKSTNPFAI
jgi:hypothetical protein